VKMQQLNGHTSSVYSVAFSHDGTCIVSGSFDSSVRVWDSSTGAELQQLNGHTDRVNSVKFSHDGTCIVSGSSDKSLRVWDASTDAELQQLNSHTRNVNSTAFSNNDTWIISSSSEHSVNVWNRMHCGVFWTSTAKGWIISLLGQNRLMWVPPVIHEVLHHPYNTLIISQKGNAHINFQGCKLGTNWAECYILLLA